MSVADALGVDLIQEFRLRKWARDNYVRPEQRGRAWHPVVLEEMTFRDAELKSEPSIELPRSPFVPLMPTESHYIDDPHAAVPPPKSLSSPAAVEMYLG
jgi:hypothetical protein